MGTDENQQNLKENEKLPHGISVTLDAFRLGCAQIRPIFGRINAQVPREKVGFSAIATDKLA